MITLPAPAKLNLFLHINNRRSDGYHNLQTVYQIIDYNDYLTLALREDDQVFLHGDTCGIAPNNNLIVKAAKALQQFAQQHSWQHAGNPTHPPVPLGADITLKKNIPMGGGLGGGSSNAATTLVGLNYLWQMGLTLATLQDIGLTLGADVPVFVAGQSAWAEGLGEQLQPLPLPERWYLVINPGCHVATKEIFSHERLTRDTPTIKVAAFLEQGGHNDCETVVKQLYPAVADAINWLQQFGAAQLTGTGACVFTAFESEACALKCLAAAKAENFHAFVAKGINKSQIYSLVV